MLKQMEILVRAGRSASGSAGQQSSGRSSGGYSNRSSTARRSTDLSVAEAFKLLGVDNTAEQSVVKRAYRKLMSQHHPDKLVAKGLPPEMLKIATEKTQHIKAAYELIKESRGWK